MCIKKKSRRIDIKKLQVLHGKNGFVERSKILAGYSNFIELLK